MNFVRSTVRQVSRLAIGAFLLFAVDAMAAPKSDCEELLNVVLPMAEKFLADHREFYAFGASMKTDRKIAIVSAYDGREKPPSQPLIDLLHDGFRKGASDGVIIASATVYDVRVVPPGSKSKTDAVAVELDHRDGYSTVVFFPYEIRDGKVEFQDAFANQGESQIFRTGGR